jgi:hypothetical protein
MKLPSPNDRFWESFVLFDVLQQNRVCRFGHLAVIEALEFVNFRLFMAGDFVRINAVFGKILFIQSTTLLYIFILLCLCGAAY